MAKLNSNVVELRLREANLAHWLKDLSLWDKEKFAGEVRQAMVEAYGVDVEFDQHIITLIADQMDTYVKATNAILTEGLVELANNGARMANPNQKIRDSALARFMQLLTMLGLVPSGRPKRSNTPTEIDELLEGPKFA
jgi:P27 family predicted phage terminase small subunit